MKYISYTVSCAVALTTVFSALADNSYVTRARVVEATPIVETVYEQVEVCRNKTVVDNPRSQGNIGNKVIGGVLGAAAGSAIGKGSGRDAAAATGALFGSEVASSDGRLSEGEIIGAIAGGVIGNQVGKGSGKTAATATGALLGAIVGDNLQNSGSSGVPRQTRVCEVQERPKKIITGYDVTFEYDSIRFSQVMPREPGEYVNININVEALEESTSLR